MMMPEVMESDHWWEGLPDGGETEILPELTPEDLEYLQGRGVLPLLGYAALAPEPPEPEPRGFGLLDVRGLLDGAFGADGWELRIGAGKAGGVVDAAQIPAAQIAAAPGFAPAHRHPTHDPNYVPPHERQRAQLGGPPPDDGKVVCERCGKGRHDPRYDQCFTCKRRDDGDDVDTMVQCRYCRRKRHKAIFESCWDCRDVAAAGADPGDGDGDDYAGGGYDRDSLGFDDDDF